MFLAPQLYSFIVIVDGKNERIVFMVLHVAAFSRIRDGFE
jgi:hypothetical protein